VDFVDPVALALTHMTLLRRLLDRCRKVLCNGQDDERKQECRKNMNGGAIQRRAKDLPSMVASAGLIPALTFYMAKASEDRFKGFLGLLGSKDIDKVNCQRIREDLEDGEGAGYSPLLALAIKALSEHNYINHVEDYVALAYELRKLRERGIDELAAEQVVLGYLLEVKKLADAFFGKENMYAREA